MGHRIQKLIDNPAALSLASTTRHADSFLERIIRWNNAATKHIIRMNFVLT